MYQTEDPVKSVEEGQGRSSCSSSSPPYIGRLEDWGADATPVPRLSASVFL